MTWTYSLTQLDQPLMQVRALIPDTLSARPLLQDEEITALLALEYQSVRRAAATALETIATDQALLLKVLQMGDERTDGAKLAAALVARAKTLREQAEQDDAAAGVGFDWSEWVLDPATARARVWDEVEREGA